jgi:uncharacterized protein RhaS with RHS repeats
LFLDVYSYRNPKSGRFTQPDPIGLAGGLNAYGFANSDPISFRDPFGLSACTDEENGAAGNCADGSSEAADEEAQSPRYHAPDMYVAVEFKLDFTDQNGNLHHFTLHNVTFERLQHTKVRDRGARGMDAVYAIRHFDAQSSSVPGEVLVFATRVPIRSTLTEISRGNYFGGFVQHGPARGRFYRGPYR